MKALSLIYIYLVPTLLLLGCAQMPPKPEDVIDIPLPPMSFVKIAAGKFQMGSPANEVERWDDEVLHTVTLTKSFEIQTTEVTQAQWFAIMKTNPSEFRKRQHCPTDFIENARTTLCPNLPVDMISWDDAQEFAKKLNERRDGFLYRLPTEAEWEYAARAGSSAAYASGNDPQTLSDFAWFETNSGKQTHAVATKKPTRNGLYDVHGNVWEWVQDWHDAFPPGDLRDPVGPEKGESRIIRGGSWGNDAYGTRLANRGLASPAVRSIGVGFRLARTLDPSVLAKATVIHLLKNGTEFSIGSDSERIFVPIEEFKAHLNAALAVPSDYRPEIREKFELHQRGKKHDPTELKRSLGRMRELIHTHKIAEESRLQKQIEALEKKSTNIPSLPTTIHEANLLGPTLVDRIFAQAKFEKSLNVKTQRGFELNIAQSYLKPTRLNAKFVNVPAGTFQMGSPPQEADRDDNEVLHTVTLTKNFEIQETKVTQTQWLAVMGYNPSEFKQREHCPAEFTEADGESMCPRHPVESVSWLDAQTFISRLNRAKDGYTYRLPTEAEREYAGRGGTQTTYFSGNDIRGLQDVAWYFDNSGDFTRAVGLKKPNAFGLYDVHGDVWEWVQDWYGPYPTTPRTDPIGPRTSKFRSIRGGSWFSVAKYLRSANRGNAAIDSRAGIIGLRLVRTK